jgi:hypothetical protein
MQKFPSMCRIQLGQPATVKVSANLIRLLAYQNKVCLYSHFIMKISCMASFLSHMMLS